MKIRGNTVGTPIKPAKVLEKALKSETESHEQYFDIDSDGIISLKPEYRGHSTDTNYPYSESNEGWGFEGSLIGDLPEMLIIPDTVNGISVTGFQPGTFRYNHRVKEITIPNGVTELPAYFCRNASNLRAIHNTEQITKIGGGIFSYTRLEKLNLPNLTEFGGNNSLAMCGFLYSVDIGDNLTEIPAGMFAQCVSLAIVKGGANVTSIGNQAFYQTHNLKTLSFLPHVTSIGANAFYRSRILFDWDSIKTQCTFGAYATPVQDNTTDYWTGVECTPCKNRLGTIMSQSNAEWKDNLVWKDKENGINFKTRSGSNIIDLAYINCCSIFSVLHIHSALSGTKYNHPDEFVKEAVSKYPNWGGDALTPTEHAEIIALFGKLGYNTVVHNGITSTSYKAMLDALARGAYVYTQVSTKSKPDDGHVFVIYGINGNGEVLAIDPQNLIEGSRATGEIDNLQLCRLPYQNITGPNSMFIIVEK